MPAAPLTKAPTAREALEHARSVVARWEAEQVNAQGELELLEQSTGEEVLANPDSAAQVARTRAELRERAAVAAQTLATAQDRLEVAERAFLRAEAEALTPRLERARNALAAFDGKTSELLAALQDHTGGPEWEPRPLEWGMQFPCYRRPPLADAVASLERAQQALRLAADGLDPFVNNPFPAVPDLTGQDLPASVWGPDAVLPLVHYARQVQNRERRRREHAVAVQAKRRRLEVSRSRAEQIRALLAAGAHRHEEVELRQELAALEGTAQVRIEGASIDEQRVALENLQTAVPV